MVMVDFEGLEMMGYGPEYLADNGVVLSNFTYTWVAFAKSSGMYSSSGLEWRDMGLQGLADF